MRSLKVAPQEADLVRQFRRMDCAHKATIVRLCTRMAARSKHELDSLLALIASTNKGGK